MSAHSLGMQSQLPLLAMREQTVPRLAAAGSWARREVSMEGDGEPYLKVLAEPYLKVLAEPYLKVLALGMRLCCELIGLA